jgi:hypothetical protein
LFDADILHQALALAAYGGGGGDGGGTATDDWMEGPENDVFTGFSFAEGDGAAGHVAEEFDS